MLLKTIIFTFLAVAVFADDYQVSEDVRAQIRDLLRAQCRMNNAEDKAVEVENAGKSFVDCVNRLVDVPTLRREIDEASANGALDEVFKKYCDKTPQLKTCIYTLLGSVAPCMNANERDQMSSNKNNVDQLIDLICEKDGDKIAMFIAEGGPQCYQSKSNEIKSCTTNFKNSFTSIEAVRNLSSNERCGKFDELSNCVVNKLESCENPTTANMADSLLRYVRERSLCKAIPKLV